MVSVDLVKHTEARMTVTVCDNQMLGQGEIGDYSDCQVEFKRNDAGAGTLAVPYSNPLAQLLRPRRPDGTRPTVPVIVDIEVGPPNAVGVRQTLRWPGLVMSSSLKGDVDNPIITATLVHYWEILKHMQAWPNPALDVLVQAPAFDFQIGPVATVFAHYIRANAQRLGIPVVVINPAAPDLSPIINLAARMTTISDLVTKAIKDVDWTVTCTLWLPGDPPIPGYASITNPTIVFQTVPMVSRPGVFFSDTTGEAFGAEVVDTAQTAHTVIGGGKSPDVVNQLLVNLLGGFIGGLLANYFLAFNLYVDAVKKAAAGVYGLPEVFVAAGTQAFTTNILQAGIQGLFDTSGKTRATFSVLDNLSGRTFGIDYGLGDQVAAELWGEVHTEPVQSVVFKDDRSTGLTSTIACGLGEATEVPLLKVVRRLQDLVANVQSLITA